MANSPSAEHALDEDDVRELLRASAPSFPEGRLELVAEGWDNAIWRLGDELAVRIPRRELAAALITHEQRALPELGPRLAAIGILTPIPIVSAGPTGRFPWRWSVVPWIGGEHALGLPRSRNAAWAERLATALSVIHVPAPDDAPTNTVRGGPLRIRDGVMQKRLGETPDSHPLRDAWLAGLEASPTTERVWIHGDLHPGNVLVDEEGLSGLIDFGDVTAGDPAYDIAVSWMLFDEVGRAAFRTATRDRYDEAGWTRARAWAAYIALMLLTQSDDRPELLALGHSTARELALR